MKNISLIARLLDAGDAGIYTRASATTRMLVVLGWVACGAKENGLTHWRWIGPEVPKKKEEEKP